MYDKNKKDLMKDYGEEYGVIIRPTFLPLKQVTKIYGLSRAYLYQLRYERKLMHYTLGARTFIKISELEDLIERGKKK